MTLDEKVVERLAKFYGWLDSQIAANNNTANPCQSCGRCCDFETFDHYLFVTTPELMYLAANTNVERLELMSAGRCPYNLKGKCTVYENRFASCRIFYCKGDNDFQSKLSESAIGELRSICEEFKIPYLYMDLAKALKSFAG